LKFLYRNEVASPSLDKAQTKELEQEANNIASAESGDSTNAI
jgi:hypothetical protein